MKANCLLFLALPALAVSALHAQEPADPPAEVVVEAAALPETPDGIPVVEEGPMIEVTPPEPAVDPDEVPPPFPLPGAAAVDGAAPFAPLENQKREIEESDDGFIIKDAGLNDIFQFLARSAGRQYFHNVKINGPEYLVTGHLNDGNPLMQMEELAFMYGLSLHMKGSTIYALTQAQLAQLPSAEFHYQLRYLRPTDIDQIKELVKPMLSPGTGIVNFEPKTNTIIVVDSAHKIEQVRQLLHGIDKAKGQIIVETKILRINSNAAERVGVDWRTSLGSAGVPLAVARDLGSVFGLPSQFAGGEGSIGSNLVLSPLQISGVLRALADGGLASQVSNPTLITEDNEQATISIIDRIPIITQTVTPGAGGSQPIITEEVRYKIDTSDKSIDTDPDKHREIGISLVVTPTALPDGTVRMKIRPRSAQIVENVRSVTGNFYPRVTESMIESFARVPDGHSLVLGGFYGETQNQNRSKVPILGDVPILNFFFKSRESIKEKTSLVFIVTPKSYDPTRSGANSLASARVHSTTVLDCDHDWVDEQNPGPAHEPNFRRSMRGLQPHEAPYYPRAIEVKPVPTRSRFSNTFRGK